MTQIIAFQGRHGAYHEQALKKIYPGAKTLPCETFDEAFKAVNTDTADLAIIAIDNTIAGRVADVHRLLPTSNLHIIAETFEPICHALMAVEGATIQGLTDVHSHIHALPQCQNIIKELELRQNVRADTAGAAEDIAKMGDPTQAVIASPLAAEIYGLKVLKQDVQDADHNTTRFLIFAKEPHIPEYDENKHYITSFMFGVRNIPAALYKSLGGFATSGVNMVKLESYVNPDFQAARFYADFIGHPEERSFQLAIEELGFYAEDVQLFGTYEASSFRKL